MGGQRGRNVCKDKVCALGIGVGNTDAIQTLGEELLHVGIVGAESFLGICVSPDTLLPFSLADAKTPSATAKNKKAAIILAVRLIFLPTSVFWLYNKSFQILIYRGVVSCRGGGSPPAKTV